MGFIKEEEAERCERWDHFLDLHEEFRASQDNSDGGPYSEGVSKGEGKDEHLQEVSKEGGTGKEFGGEGAWKVDTWGEIRPSLWPVEGAMCIRIKKRSLPSPPISAQKSGDLLSELATLPRIINSPSKYASEDDSDEEFYDVERPESVHDSSSQPETPVSSSMQMVADAFTKDSCPWKEELEALVRGGVPMAFRGELWQVFVGTRTRRVQGHYDALLMLLADGGGESDGIGGLVSAGNTSFYSLSADSRILEKWTSQIEKDLPRTFPGHPALDENGRNALRRLLTAYARHNPDVGYCQAMNFFAALLLLLMPEENAFWTLAGIIDDYFEGYYSEKMVEAQVDQLVFEDLIREYFPRLANHLDSLGVQVAWVSGPWFLSIFVNVLPWECVLRVWDVLLYEGNRSMLFRTALALMDLHGPAIMATKDAGDAVTLLQSSAGATFDSSLLVLTACMGYQMVDEARLQELRAKHRPNVLASLQERSMGHKVFHDSPKGASAELGKAGTVNNTDHHPVVEDHAGMQGDLVKKSTSDSSHLNGFATNIAADGICLSPEKSALLNSSNIGSNGFHSVEEGSAIELGEQVKWLKNELCRVLEENRVATLRAEELQTAFVELVKQDNRRFLTAKIESLEEEVTELKKKLADKEEQEQAMVQVMLRMEQEQGYAEEARRYAETDAAAQRNNAEILQKKYEDVISEIAAMENRAIMAESMLEATLQYQALGPGQVPSPKVHSETSRFGDEEMVKSSRSRIPFSPRKDSADSSKGLIRQDAVSTSKEVERPKESQSHSVDPSQKHVVRSRSFALGWLDRTKAKTVVGDVQNGLPVTPVSVQNGLETVIEDDTNKANGMLIHGKSL